MEKVWPHYRVIDLKKSARLYSEPMSLIGRSFLSTENLSLEDTESLFSTAKIFKTEFNQKQRIDHLIKDQHQRCLALAFFEPSTRTRLSFQMAAFRLGFQVASLDSVAVSSVSKGETLSDTLKVLAAMKPDALVVRYGENSDLEECINEMQIPVINAGSGLHEHPTQAVLDAFTILENRGKIKGEKVLIIGDVLHSRVANSALLLLTKLGAEVAFCAPEEFIPQSQNWKAAKKFNSLSEGVQWASVCMCLRIQKERHTLRHDIGRTMAEYREQFRFGSAQLKIFLSDGILLHPGPVIRGIEMSTKALEDPRSKVLDQVTNGVFVRAAILAKIFGLEVKQK